MIPGEPLINPCTPITPPGVHHPNPATDTAQRMLLGVAIVVTIAAFVWWFRSVSPDDDWCGPEASCPTTPAG